MSSPIDEQDRGVTNSGNSKQFLALSFATPKQFAFFGLFYVVLATVTWVALHRLAIVNVPNFAFTTMVLSGLSFSLFPSVGRQGLGIWLGLWGTWLSVFLLAQNLFFGPVFAVSGFIIVTLMVMIFERGRVWIWMTLFSVCAIAYLNLVELYNASASSIPTETLALMVSQLAQFLGAAVLFAIIFAKFREMLVDAVTSNAQLSEQQERLEQHALTLAQLNHMLNEEVLHTAELQHASEQAAEALKSKTELLEIITHNLPARVVYTDTNETIQFFNPEFAKRFGIAHLTPPINIQTHIKKDVIDSAQPSIDQAMTTGKMIIAEFNEQDAEGQPCISRKVFVPHIVNGEVVGRVTLGIDVTELRSTQASLQQVNRILNYVNDNLPARITYMDVNGRLLYSNRYPELVGEHHPSLLGCSQHVRLLGAGASTLSYHGKRAFEGESGDFELRRLLPNGEEVVEMVRYVPQKEQDELVGIFTLSTDVTESRHLEEMFQQSQKLESLGMLAGGVAHDFNNLLAGVLGQSSVALARMDVEHPSRKHVGRAMDAARRASMLTKQMLAYSGKGAFSVALLDLNELIQQNLELLSVTLPRNVKLNLELADNLPLIEADESQIQQVVMNLIINAGQAIGERSGEISVTTSVVSISAEIDTFSKITGKPLYPGTYASIRITDNGDGIRPELVTRIFDPFYTTKDSGTGLGLAAVLGVIRGHSGGIQLTTAVGEGTEFHLLFPIADEIETMVIPVKPASDVVPTQKSSRKGGSLVLVIDDELDVLEVVTDMLEFNGIPTITASSGEKGLALFKQFREQISLVLLDLMMPGMNGDETLRALREIDPHVHIILSSGYTEAEAGRRVIGSKVADFIQKPYAIEQLMKKINAAVVVT